VASVGGRFYSWMGHLHQPQMYVRWVLNIIYHFVKFYFYIQPIDNVFMVWI